MKTTFTRACETSQEELDRVRRALTTYEPGEAVYVWSYRDGRKFEREAARTVTGHIRMQRWEGVGDPEPHVLIEFTECGTRIWEPVRKVYRAHGSR